MGLGGEAGSLVPDMVLGVKGDYLCAPSFPRTDLISLLLSTAFFAHSFAFVMVTLNVAGPLLGAESLG